MPTNKVLNRNMATDNTHNATEDSGEIGKPDLDSKKQFMVKLREAIELGKAWLAGRDPQNAEVEEAVQAKESIVDNDNSDRFSTASSTVSDVEALQEMLYSGYWHKFKTFEVVPQSNAYYYWTFLVSLTCLYNLMFVVARWTFMELNTDSLVMWLCIDYISDAINWVDIFLETRKGYLEQGLVVKDKKKLALNYIYSLNFFLDFISILPTDLLYIWVGMDPWPRFNRLLRYRRLFDFSDRTETRTSWPNTFRVFKLIGTIFILFHWNACAYFGLSKEIGLNTDQWAFNYDRINNPNLCHCTTREPQDCAFNKTLCVWEEWEFSNLTKQYVFSLYWSALILTTIGEQKAPVTKDEFLFVIIDILIGLLIFASIIGNVGSMVSNMNAAQAEFLDTLDGVKQYMEYRKVVPDLKKKVLSWFSYINSQKQAMDEEGVLGNIPTKLRAELAIQVHLDTLRRVNLFKDCEPGLLVELVLKLKLQVYSPVDYLCRKGDIGKEMYIVKRGSIQVVAEDGVTVFVTLKEGSVVGELSVLDIPGNKNGNKRTASIRSVGYTDVFVLSKEDLWDALKEYPEAKKMLLAKGREILKKDKLLAQDAPEDDPGLENLDKKLIRIARNVEAMETTFQGLNNAFVTESAQLKQRLTKLENLMKSNKEKIKRIVRKQN